MNNIPHILKAVAEEPWAIKHSWLMAMLEVLNLRANGVKLSPDEIEAQLEPSREAAAARPRANVPGGVAVVNVFGAMMKRGGLFDDVSGMSGMDVIAAQLRAAAANPDIKAVVLNIDSPGGMVSGLPELAAEVAAMDKFVLAVANGMAASAAYWLGSQADEFVMTTSGEVGSIGVVSMHQDISRMLDQQGVDVTVLTSSKYKYEGHPYQPLSDEARAHMQKQIDEFDQMFVKAVAKGRGVSMAKVRADFGQGRTMLARDALAAGMVDRVATLDEELRKLGGAVIPGKRLIERAAAHEQAERLAAESADMVADVDVDDKERARRQHAYEASLY